MCSEMWVSKNILLVEKLWIIIIIKMINNSLYYLNHMGVITSTKMKTNITIGIV